MLNKKGYSDKDLVKAAEAAIDRVVSTKDPDEAEQADLRFQGLWKILLKRQEHKQND